MLSLEGDVVFTYQLNISQMCGPTGVGFLYGKFDLLNSMSPFLGNIHYHFQTINLLIESCYISIISMFLLSLGGGEMISEVLKDYSTYAEPPSR